MPTLNEARKLFKTYAASKYRGSRYIALDELIEATYKGRPRIEDDITAREYTIKAERLRRAIRVQDRQLANLLRDIEEVNLISREDGLITYRLDLSPLEKEEPAREVEKRRKQQQTEKARQKKAAQRAAKREPDYSKMNAFELVEHGIKSFSKGAGTL
jgi:hypothetical protein